MQKYEKFKNIVERDGLPRAFRVSIDQLHRNYLAKQLVSLQYRRHRLTTSLSAVSNPFKLIWVSPATIQYITDVDYPNESVLDPSDKVYCKAVPETSKFHRYVERGSFEPYRDLGRIVDGTWDTERTRFDELYVFQSMKNHFESNIPWKDTLYFEMMAERIENGYPQRECTTPEQYAEQCKSFDLLYEAMEQYGCLPKRFITGSFTFDEICVNIGREGGLFFNTDGHHRLSIAKILEVEQVPVLVCARHKEWQKKRERVAVARENETFSTIEKKYLEHPDMLDILKET